MEEFHCTLRQIFQSNLKNSQKSRLIAKMQTDFQFEQKMILILTEQDPFEQKYIFNFEHREKRFYSDFKSKITFASIEEEDNKFGQMDFEDLKKENRRMQIEVESRFENREGLEEEIFESESWGYFKQRIFTILFASENLIYDVIEIIKEEKSFENATNQQNLLYFYAFLGDFNFFKYFNNVCCLYNSFRFSLYYSTQTK